VKAPTLSLLPTACCADERSAVQFYGTQHAVFSLPYPRSTRLCGMRRFRQIAFAILFGGWMLPAFLAQAAKQRAPKAAPQSQTALELITGVAPPPTPAEQAASMFNVIALLWFLIAVVYAVVLAIRLRRTLV
jgi:hypothetical protein